VIRPRVVAWARRVFCPGLAAIVALIPVAGVFSTTSIFFVRDLGLYFWPRHLWLRQSINRGDWPLWDPYAAGGQSAVADALNQFFLLPMTFVRLTVPDVVGFNLWIALPFPLMALGAWFWLRRAFSPSAACVGAAFCGVAGPVVSSGNFPNLSWAIACIPWALWATDRVLEHRGVQHVGTLSLVFALQALAGEPVTLAATVALVIAYAATDSLTGLVPAHVAQPGRSFLSRSKPIARIAAALVIGASLSAIQTFPLLSAASRSPRITGVDNGLWSLHPLAAIETLIAHPFGHPYDATLDRLPWIASINGREPLFFTLYLGLGAIALALAASLDTRTRSYRLFWWLVAAIGLLFALGDHTPVYPFVQSLVPVLQSFRYPVKYLVFTVVALAALASAGVEALRAHLDAPSSRRPVLAIVVLSTVGVVAASAALLTYVRPELMLQTWEALARSLSIADAPGAARWLLRPAASRLLVVTTIAAAAVLLLVAVWQRTRSARLAAAALCLLAVVDPLVVNRDLHPTLEASRLGPPDWVPLTRAYPHDRVYIGGRVRRLIAGAPPRIEYVDAPARFDADAELSAPEAQALTAGQFAYSPAAWGLRESVSYDLPQLLPREYAAMIERFRWAAPEERFRFLMRTGVRYCFVPEPPRTGDAPLVPPAKLTGPMGLYECHSDVQRAYVVPRAHVEPDPARQLDALFDADHDPDVQVLLERDPPEAEGRSGSGPAAPIATIIRESNTELVVSASAGPGGGYLVLTDSYDPFWRVAVDGVPAPLLRANALHRAVRLTVGLHEVRFVYRPTPFYMGAIVTVMTSLLLLVACLRKPEGFRLPRPL
jgi:hypothetical protein